MNTPLVIGHGVRRLHRWASSSTTVAALLALVSSGNFADLAGAERPAPTISVDAEWEALKAASGPKAFPIPVENTREAIGAARAELISDYIDHAVELRAFQTRNPDHVSVGEARALEALTLLYAGWNGDTNQQARRDQLVADVRTDPKIPTRLRAEVVANADNLEVNRQRDLSRAERLLAMEDVVRGLLIEFIDVPEAYESLLYLAKSQNDAEGRRIVTDLLEASAPDWIQTEAERLKARYQLLGRSIEELVELPPDIRTSLSAADSEGLLIYSWSVASEGSLKMALNLAASVPEDVTVLAINLDPDAEEARTVVAGGELPGMQVLADSELREQLMVGLHLSEAGLVYATHADGTIRTVSERNGLGRMNTRPAQP